MKNNLFKKALCCALTVIFVFGTLGINAFAADNCPSLEVYNLNRNDYYYYWSSVINSYLVPTENGYMRFQADGLNKKYFAEYYDNNYNITSFKIIPQELELFGGFYSDENNYYIVSGNKNLQELSTVECFRITKYDKSWNKIKSVGLFDCNTYIPFDAGNLRFAQSGKYLFIRTAHEMYAADDGYNHQANVTIQLDTETMTIVDEMTAVANIGAGYVSHSFNQFILIENGNIVALDHGDAYPRSAVLIKYPNPVSASGFSTWNCSYVDAIEIPGSFGDNYTGVELGGFEYSSSKYIIAYRSVKLDDNFKNYETKNLYITTVDKATNTVSTKQITHFAEGEGGVGTPHLVKIESDKFMLLWGESGSVHYSLVNGNGDLIGEEKVMKNAYLSDCVPLYSNGKIIWYTCNNNNTTIYDINLDSLKSTATERNSGHDMKVVNYPSEADPYCEIECEKCGFVDFIEICTEVGYGWATEDGGPFDIYAEEIAIEEGGRIYFVVFRKGDIESGNIESVFTLDDGTQLFPTMITDDYGYLTFNVAGDYVLTASHKYAPDVSYSLNLTVGAGISNDTGGLGDVNMNGKIDARDYLLLKRAYFGTYTLTCETEIADINGNGKIDARDYLLLKRMYFGTYRIK